MSEGRPCVGCKVRKKADTCTHDPEAPTCLNCLLGAHPSCHANSPFFSCICECREIRKKAREEVARGE